MIFGHDSPYRMEGNRIIYSMLDDDVIESVGEYRRDLERIGSELDISKLPRNEQLAFWLNLHNVAVIEQIGLAYPISQPRKIRIDGVPMDEARFITVDGVAMSPHDIRARIVYPNWRDPRVMYGFFRSDIGGPSLQRYAFTGSNVSFLLESSASEFVNSLRGVQSRGDALKVSRIYEEVRKFYFPGNYEGLRAHLAQFAEDDVMAAVRRNGRVEADLYEYDIADLSKGEREPAYQITAECERPLLASEVGNEIIGPGCSNFRVDLPRLAQRYVTDRREKVRQLARAGKWGNVYVLAGGEAPEEVE